MQNTVLVLSPHARLSAPIARAMRYREVYCLPLAGSTTSADALSYAPHALVLICEESDGLDWLDEDLLHCGVPVLALGGAAALLCEKMGGSVGAEIPQPELMQLSPEALFEEIPSGERTLVHVRALSLPEALIPIAHSGAFAIGYKHASLPLWGMEYPIERNDPDAAQLLFNFACAVCKTDPIWTDDCILDRTVERIREAAPEGRVLCAVSGGVDSAVCAALCKLAVGDRLTCLFADTGLLREGEAQEVLDFYTNELRLSIHPVDASDFFLKTLSGIDTLSKKESVASRLMTQVVLSYLRDDPTIRTVVMGTNLNDHLTALSASNEKPIPLGGLVLCEPLSDVFKWEVRRLATLVDLPKEWANRQPFPSSGLALRVMGLITQEKLAVLRKADNLFAQEIRADGLDRKLWQYYATLADSQSAQEGWDITLRALQSSGSGCNAARIHFDLLERTAEQIRKEIPSVRRVVYDLTPGTHYYEME